MKYAVMFLGHWQLRLIVIALVAATISSAGLVRPARATVAAPGSPVVTPCGVLDLKSISPSTQPLPANPVHILLKLGSISSLAIANDQLYVLTPRDRSIRIFTLAGQPVQVVTYDFQEIGRIAVDESGNIIMIEYPYTVHAISPSGKVLWSTKLEAQVDSVFRWSSAQGFRIGVVLRGVAGSTLLDATGSVLGHSSITGSIFDQGPDGRLVSTGGNYVHIYDANGTQLAYFGSGQSASLNARFYMLGGAAIEPDGRIYIADGERGISAATADGMYAGFAEDQELGRLTESSPMIVHSTQIFFATGGPWAANQNVAWVDRGDLEALVRQPRAPHPVLGFGAGLGTNATANYYGPGVNPSVGVEFDPWWSSKLPNLEVQYTVMERKQVVGSQSVASQVVRPAAGNLAFVPLTLPSPAPGAYEVDAKLIQNGIPIGSDCLHYSIGAPGDTLDFKSLPPGADYGGPAPSRGVALADVLGLGDFRGGIDTSALLPNCAGPPNFGLYDGPFAEAAAEAGKRGQTFHVQLGTGQSCEKQMVANGTWGSYVRQVVNHYKANVHAWEAWNEPNNTFGPAAAYVTQVLKPFYENVKAADPTATVVGGSVLGMDLGYWEAVGGAGGLASMDVAGIHPYSGHNRSFEEQGIPAKLRAMRDLLSKYGAGSMSVWDTESAWWADGPANFYSQADKAVRALLWMRSSGIDKWDYFVPEGGYGDYGLSYSLIQYAGASNPYYVKPAALALMEAKNQIGNRPFRGFRSIGIPHAFAAEFGPAANGSDSVFAIWTDDLKTTLQINVSPVGGQTVPAQANLTITDLLGEKRDLQGAQASLTIDGSPQYLTVPNGLALAFYSAEAFGQNVALAAAGSSASATSTGAGRAPAFANDGGIDATDGGDFTGIPVWASSPGDANPSLTIALGRATIVDRVLVSTHSIGSVTPGLRDFDIQVAPAPGNWVTVGSVHDNFFLRNQIVTFTPQSAVAIRVVIQSVDYGGLAGGAKPWFWPTDAASLSNPGSTYYGPALIYEMEAYEPGAAPPTPGPPPTPTLQVLIGHSESSDSSTASAPASPWPQAAPAPLGNGAGGLTPTSPEGGTAAAPTSTPRSSNALSAESALFALLVVLTGLAVIVVALLVRRRARRPNPLPTTVTS